MKKAVAANNDSSVDGHPLLTRRYTIASPMILALVAEIAQWIQNGVTGAVIVGHSRIGKSKARRFIALTLGLQFPRLPVFSMIAHHHEYSSERMFFGELLQAFRHAMYSEGTAAQRRDRLVEGVASIVQASGQTRIVLLIDQAHNLLRIHYDWLVDLFDELNERGIELFVFLFGEKGLSTMREELRRSGKTQIIGRFMLDRIEYRGIRTHAELKACLVCYDDIAKFPEDSDWTYTRHFFPEAYAKGWRLAQHSKDIWKAFDDVRRHGVVSGPMEIPMQNFTRVVERIFRTRTLTESGDPLVCHAQLVQYIADTLFAALPRGEKIDDGEKDEEEEEENKL